MSTRLNRAFRPSLDTLPGRIAPSCFAAPSDSGYLTPYPTAAGTATTSTGAPVAQTSYLEPTTTCSADT